jgi:hypothetical protein
MERYDIHLLKRDRRLPVCEGADFASLGEALGFIDTVVQNLMADDAAGDWVGCRFEVANEAGDRMLDVPVLTAMQAIAHRRRH